MLSPNALISVRRLGVLGLLAATTGCYTPTVDVMPRVLAVEFDGSISANDGSLPFGSNDFGTLRIEDEPAAFTPRVDWTSGRWDWTADWIGQDFDGIGDLEAGLVIDGVTFPAGNTVATDAELSLGRLAVTYDLVEHPDTIVGLGAGIGIVRADAVIRDLDSGAISETDQDGIAPHFVGRVGHVFGELEVQLLVGWLDFQLNDIDTEYFDADAFLRWRFRSRDEGITWAIVAGYRHLLVDSSYNEEDFDEDIDWKSELRGPYLGFSVGF